MGNTITFKKFNDTISLTERDPMIEISKKYMEQTVKEQEIIIKEAALKGFKYLVIRQDFEYDFENNCAKCVFKYQPFNSKYASEAARKEGFEVYELDNVREYLKNREVEK